MTFVKICGLTNPEDAQAAIDLGADMIGFVNAERSPRYLTPDEISSIISEINPTVPTVLVTRSQDVTDILNSFEAAGTDLIQLHAPLSLSEYFEIQDLAPMMIANVSIDSELKRLDESLKKRVSQISGIADYVLFDTKFGNKIGGTGKSYDWGLAAQLKEFSKKPVFIAGGLHPANVSVAVRQVKPFGVDVSSGVETRPGEKDHNLIRMFIKNAKLAGKHL